MMLNLNERLFNENFKYLKMFEMHNKLVYCHKKEKKSTHNPCVLYHLNFTKLLYHLKMISRSRPYIKSSYYKTYLSSSQNYFTRSSQTEAYSSSINILIFHVRKPMFKIPQLLPEPLHLILHDLVGPLLT